MVYKGYEADIYLAAGTGNGTTMTDEPCSVVGGAVYQIDDTAKRFWDPGATFEVKANAVVISPASYVLSYASGKITFNAVPAAPVTVSGKYLTLSRFLQAHNWSLNISPNLQEVTAFQEAWVANTSPTRGGTATIMRYSPGGPLYTSEPGDQFVMKFFENSTAPGVGPGYRFTAFADDAISAPAEGVVEDSLSFTVSGEIDWEPA